MKKPWNRINIPVYSVSSRHGEKQNMHICTYVSAVSMQPKRFMVALFKGSLTLEMVELNQHFVLQLMEEKQYRLVDLLGRKSGRDIDKISLLKRRKVTTEWKNFIVLKDALAWMELSVISSIDAGDHVMMLCDLVAAKNVRDGNPLTLDTLREKKLIRI
jgi:flavin reductase (DIM6/NTAB) family NADH-FMN oxidoreductase RutF